MSDEVSQIRLQEANRLFQSKNYSECESTLRSMPSQKDPKVAHNIAIAHYLAKGGDARDTIRELTKEGSGPISLDYEGHEIAHYNRAVLLAYNGRNEEAATVLRELLQLHECVSIGVLGRSVCLLQLVTNETAIGRPAAGTAGAKKGPSIARSKSDDDLITKTIAQYMVDFKKDAILSKMLSMSIAGDGSALHELFKTGSSPVERAVYLNDLGVMAMSEGKVNVACLYFTKAHRLLSDPSVSTDAQTKHSVLFNYAISCIHRQDFNPAIKALIAAQESMKSSPALWVRLAQACLGWHHVGWSTVDAGDAHEAQQRELAATLAKGAIFPGFPLLQIPDSATLSGNEHRRVFLVVASRAAQNCMHLLGASSAQDGVERLVTEGRLQDFRTLQYALIYTAAAELLVQNYAVVAKLTSDLLAVHRTRPLVPDVHATALLYASEAYCKLNKPQQALKIMSVTPFGELLVSADRTDGLQKQRTEALFINLVLVHIANGSWKQAQALVQTIISKISTSANSAIGKTASLLQIYVDLAQGNKEKVLELLAKTTPPIPAIA